MSDEKKYFCFCSSNCKYETMTKEQILTAIAQALSTGKVENVDTGFITKVKETNGGRYVTFWVGTQAEYNALKEKKTDCLYIITDSAANQAMELIAQEVKAMKETLDTMADHIIYYWEDVNFAHFLRKYSDGSAELFSQTKWQLSFTTARGGFYAADAGKQAVLLEPILHGVVPEMCTVNVTGTTKTDESGNTVKGPCMLAMVGGRAEYREGYGVASPSVLLISEERAENVTIDIEVHCRWKWKVEER